MAHAARKSDGTLELKVDLEREEESQIRDDLHILNLED